SWRRILRDHQCHRDFAAPDHNSRPIAGPCERSVSTTDEGNLADRRTGCWHACEPLWSEGCLLDGKLGNVCLRRLVARSRDTKNAGGRSRPLIHSQLPTLVALRVPEVAQAFQVVIQDVTAAIGEPVYLHYSLDRSDCLIQCSAIQVTVIP